jgi:hypothetical protein
MCVFSIDKHNPPYKGPFNAQLSFARVFTPDDTAFVTPNSDTPHTFLSLDCCFQNYWGSGAHLVKRWSVLTLRSEHRLIRPDGEYGATTYFDRSICGGVHLSSVSSAFGQ